jgi:hypothetical protein
MFQSSPPVKHNIIHFGIVEFFVSVWIIQKSLDSCQIRDIFVGYHAIRIVAYDLL